MSGGSDHAVALGPGAVFEVESDLYARRPTIYAGRSLFVLALLAGLTILWSSVAAPPR